MDRITVCNENMCTGCNACINICSKSAIKISDNNLSLNAIIDLDKCIDCGLCRKVCQQNNVITHNKPISWYQGWANDENTRIKAASGGFATVVANHFLDKNYSVYACAFIGGEFIYKKIPNKDDFKQCIGSKYVKSNTGKIYCEIKKDLISGQNVLFIGLPCHVEGLKLFIGEKLQKSLYTVDLVCHGTPSFELYKKYYKELGIDLNTIESISFRHKLQYTDSAQKSFQYWDAPFVDGLTFTYNCYHCKFACEGRISDITIGDAWGSTLNIDEKNKGISLILCNTQKGKKLIDSLDFSLNDVDEEIAKKNNKQLQQPMKLPQNRIIFETSLTKQNNYHKAIKNIYKKSIVKSNISFSFIGKILKKLIKRDSDSTQVRISCFEQYKYK